MSTLSLSDLVSRFANYIERHILPVSNDRDKCTLVLTVMRTLPEFMLLNWVYKTMSNKDFNQILDEKLEEFAVDKKKLGSGQLKKLSTFFQLFQQFIEEPEETEETV